MEEKRIEICNNAPWMCPHIIHLNKSLGELTISFQAVITKITTGDSDLTEDAQKIIAVLQETLPIEDLKASIKEITDWLLQKQQAMMWEIQRLQEDVEELGKDHLTGLYTRHRYAKDFLTLQQKFIETNEEFSCAVIDVDNFKKINDTCSHIEWDKVLKYLARILTVKFWNQYVYRYGWEEFIILYKWKKENLYKWLNEVLDFLNSPPERRTIKTQFTFSWWVTIYHQDDTSASLFERADRLMYKGKHNWKNQVICD